MYVACYLSLMTIPLVMLKVKKRNTARNKLLQKTSHKLQQLSEKYQPGDSLKEGTLVFILLSP
jgi:hypothetical protein